MFRRKLKFAQNTNAQIAAAAAERKALALRKVGCAEVKAELRRNSAIRTWEEFFGAYSGQFAKGAVTRAEMIGILQENWREYSRDLGDNPMPSEEQFSIFDTVTPENVGALASFDAIDRLIYDTFTGRFKKGRTAQISTIGTITGNPLYNKYATINSSANNSDCLIHSFLTIGCNYFRGLSKEDKNIVARKFRTCVYPNTPQFLAKQATEDRQNLNTDHNIELRVLRPGTYLIDNDVTNLCRFLSVQVVIYELLSRAWININGNFLQNMPHIPCYMLYNNGGHFEGVCAMPTPPEVTPKYIIPFEDCLMLIANRRALNVAEAHPGPSEEEQLAAALAESALNVAGVHPGPSEEEQIAALAKSAVNAEKPLPGPLHPLRVPAALPPLKKLPTPLVSPFHPLKRPAALPHAALPHLNLKKMSFAQRLEAARGAAATAARKAAEEKASLAELQRLREEQTQIDSNAIFARSLGEEQTQIDSNEALARRLQGGRKRTRTRRRGRTLKRRSRRRL